MKKVIRLSESDLVRIVKRVIKEQAFSLGGLESMPDTGYDAVDSSPQTICQQTKKTSELVLELFSKLRGVSGQPNPADKTIQSWILRLNNSIKGIGTSGDLNKVFSEIKTQQQMGSVLNAYNKKFGKPLYEDLSGEVTVSWDTIWKLSQKFGKGFNITACKTLKQQTA
jgi:hypothetical protein